MDSFGNLKRLSEIDENRTSTPLLLSIIAVSIIGICLRFYGLKGDLWLDEIWTFDVVKGLKNPWKLLFGDGLDGRDSSLYSVLLYYFGPDAPARTYRLPSFILSVISFLVLYRLTFDFSVVPRLTIFILYSFSYTMTLYSSEARGYGPALFFGLCAFLALKKILEDVSGPLLALFWICILLGFFFHFSFLQFYIALIGWSVCRWWKDEGTSYALRNAIIVHCPLFLLIGSIYLFALRKLQPGSGPLSSNLDIIVNTISVAVGGPETSSLPPEQGVWILALAGFIVCCSCLEIFLLVRKKPEEAIMFFIGIIFIPAIICTIIQPRVLVLRYFLFSILLLYFLMARFLERICDKSIFGKILTCLLLATFCIGQFQYFKRFSIYYRGQYSIALKYIANQTQADPITIGSDHDFRNSMMVNYYAKKLKVESRIQYVGSDELTNNPPKWYIMHSQSPIFTPSTTVIVGGEDYVLEQFYRFTALSGWHWAIYRKQKDG